MCDTVGNMDDERESELIIKHPMIGLIYFVVSKPITSTNHIGCKYTIY